jgi:hypothetical protein
LLKLSYEQRRVIIVAAGLPFIICLVNFIAERKLFYFDAKLALGLSAALFFGVWSLFGPAMLSEMQERSDKEAAERLRDLERLDRER